MNLSTSHLVPYMGRNSHCIHNKSALPSYLMHFYCEFNRNFFPFKVSIIRNKFEIKKKVTVIFFDILMRTIPLPLKSKQWDEQTWV